jgi:hypothetical protein
VKRTFWGTSLEVMRVGVWVTILNEVPEFQMDWRTFDMTEETAPAKIKSEDHVHCVF